MSIIKLEPQGKLSLPQEILNQFGLGDQSTLLVETTADGAILLRPTEIYAVEIYNNEQIQEFLEDDLLTPEETERLKVKLAQSQAE